MSKARRRKAARKPPKREEPKRVVSIAATPSDGGPVLYALTEEGEIYEYGIVKDPDQGIEVGMWEQLSTIEPRNIIDAIDSGDDDEEEEEEDDEDEDDEDE